MIEGNCTCNDGYGGSDCSFDVSSPATITRLSGDGVCDKSSVLWWYHSLWWLLPGKHENILLCDKERGKVWKLSYINKTKNDFAKYWLVAPSVASTLFFFIYLEQWK